MFGFDKEKERERFYLLPGQGGRSLRRKRRLMLLSALVIGLLASAALALVLYLINRPHR